MHLTSGRTRSTRSTRSAGRGLRVKAAGTAALLAAGMFTAAVSAAPAAHAAAAALTVTNPVLVFDQGASVITLTSDQATVSYSVADEAGVPVTSGTAPVSGGSGSINLNALGPGYYTLSVTAGGGSSTVTTVPTTFVVLEPFAPGTAHQDQRFGMDMHFGHQPNDATLFQLMARLGITETRTDQNWASVEKTAGTYTWPGYITDTDVPLAKQAGINTLLISAYRNPLYDGGYTPYTPAGWAAYGAYTNAVADHFGQYTKDIEIYNEFNGGFDNAAACAQTMATKVSCYLNMTKAVYQAVKVNGGHTDTNLIGPVSAGIDQPWISGLLDGGLLNYIDTFSVHQYAISGAPETSYANIAWLKQAIRDHNGGRDMPLWLTETGTTVMPGVATEAQQADLAVRLPVLAFAAGVDKYFWYDLLNDGTSSSDKEANFGQLKQPTAGVLAQAPKPALATQATILRQIGGLAFAGGDGLAAPAYSYKFGTGSTAARVMWATTPTTVRVATSDPVTVTDEFGRSTDYLPVGGGVTLSLDTHPVFVRGTYGWSSQPTVSVDSQPAVTLTVPQSSNTSETIPVTVTSHTPIPVRGTVAGTPFAIGPNPFGTKSVTVQVPSTKQLGDRTLVAEAGVGPIRFARLAAHTAVVPATAVSTEPEIVSANPEKHRLKITVANNRRSMPLAVGSLYWQLNDGAPTVASGTLTGIADVPPASSATFEVDVPTLTVWNPHWFFDRLTDKSGVQSTDQGWIGWNPVEPAGTANAPALNLGTQVQRSYPAANGGYGGAADLSGSLRPSFTATGLRLTADVTDNVQYQPAADPSQMWSADSIQFAVTPALPGRDNQRVELGAALLPGGPAVYTWSPPPGQAAGPTPGATAVITRSGTVTHYQIDVPWSALGMTGQPTAPFGLSLLLNDNDGKGRNTAAWGDGIATTKSASLLRPVQLVAD